MRKQRYVATAFLLSLLLNYVSIGVQGFLPVAERRRHHRRRQRRWLSLSATTTTTTSVLTHFEDDGGDDDNDAAVGAVPAAVEVIPPGGRFRDTDRRRMGEFSVVSYNALAPSYHALRLHDDDEAKASSLREDRLTRVPSSLRTAKNVNADILCLQEVEGGGSGIGDDGDESLSQTLRNVLAADDHDENNNTTTTTKGYDECLWTPLHPQRVDDVVGLAVAWRSSKFRLVSYDAFRRGVVVTLREVISDGDDNDNHNANATTNATTTATVIVANVHLPARPSAVEGRLRVTASAVRRIQRQHQQQLQQEAAGPVTAVLCGDMNTGADHLRRYLRWGRVGSSHGKKSTAVLRDRNYRLRLSKTAAAALRHDLRFQHVYDETDTLDRAAVTVSLRGRGPGRVDHVYYHHAPDAIWQRPPHPPPSSPQSLVTRSSKRRRRSSRPPSLSQRRPFRPRQQQQHGLRVEAVLATLDDDDEDDDSRRTRCIIHDGLPNEAEGFYSDHLPVGALFVPVSQPSQSPLTTQRTRTVTAFSSDDDDDNKNDAAASHGSSSSGLSSRARRRQATYRRSAVVRRRHNAVLNALLETLHPLTTASSSSMTLLLRDVPLYKWPWIQQSTSSTSTSRRIGKKGRRPDACGVVVRGGGGADATTTITTHTLVVLEVTVVSADRVDAAYRDKRDKYQDVMDVLATTTMTDRPSPSSSVVPQEADPSSVIVAAPHAHVICLDEEGHLAAESRRDLEHLLLELCGQDRVVVDELVQEFRWICQNFQVPPQPT